MPLKRMNFRKSSKRPLTILQIFFLNFMLQRPCLKVQNMQHKFWNFSENSSVLVAPPVPNWFNNVTIQFLQPRKKALSFTTSYELSDR